MPDQSANLITAFYDGKCPMCCRRLALGDGPVATLIVQRGDTLLDHAAFFA